MQRVFSFERTKFHQFKLTLRVAAVFLSCIILLLTFGTLQSNFLYWTFLFCFTHYMLPDE